MPRGPLTSQACLIIHPWMQSSTINTKIGFYTEIKPDSPLKLNSFLKSHIRIAMQNVFTASHNIDFRSLIYCVQG